MKVAGSDNLSYLIFFLKVQISENIFLKYSSSGLNINLKVYQVFFESY